MCGIFNHLTGMGIESSTPPTLVPVRNFADYSGAKAEFRTFVLLDFSLLNYLALFVNIKSRNGQTEWANYPFLPLNSSGSGTDNMK